jgi:DedD protein
MASSQDTEITLGTGKMLLLFFALVALCGVFFGVGFKMGKSYGGPLIIAGKESATITTSAGGSRPSAVKSSSSSASPDLALYKSASQKDDSAAAHVEDTAASNGEASPPDPSVATPASGYYVQVAAVSKQEDGEALVDALKKKQYPAFAAAGPDKLYHVQVGPFADIKNAEDMRAKLTNDGYNPILKK